jgi:hypothetical protein
LAVVFADGAVVFTVVTTVVGFAVAVVLPAFAGVVTGAAAPAEVDIVTLPNASPDFPLVRSLPSL